MESTPPSLVPSGLDLAHGLYEEVVAPHLDLPHTACLIGEGSEVLGYDDVQSRDHEWGPRLQLFLAREHVPKAERVISEHLPSTYRGLPTTWFSLTAGKPAHHVEINTLEDWLHEKLPTIPPSKPDVASWLTMPQQHLLQLTAGAVFHDDPGDLTSLRRQFTWYPADVWRWIIASQWHLLSNTVPMLGRTHQTKDVLGARILMARCCRLAMEMAFLQRRRYQPYPKWFGRAFTELEAVPPLTPLLDEAMTGSVDHRSLDALLEALRILAESHNELSITAPVTPRIDPFAVGINDAVRPYNTLNIGEFIEATIDSIEDPSLRDLSRVGSVDQLTHSDDQLINFTTWPQTLQENFRRQLSGEES